MVKNKVAEVAQRKGVKNAYELMRDGGIGAAVSYSLWDGTAKSVSFETLDKLCGLLKCQPGLLFEHQPERERPAETEGVDILGRRVKAAAYKSRKKKSA